MKKFLSLLFLATVAGTGTLYAQYTGDALRFSQTNYGSSARFKGLGNAQIGLGGDISSLGGNPAGLGMFTRSEFSITPEFNNSAVNSTYLGTNSKSTKDMLNLNQVGVVWYSPIVKRRGADLNKGALSVVWGLGYNRNNDFSANYGYSGQNGKNSIADYFAASASGLGVAPADLSAGTSLESMAYNNFLIDPLIGNNKTYVPATDINNTQSVSEVRLGSTSTVNLSAAINISNSLYLGASLGYVNVRYDRSMEVLESGQNISNNTENQQAGADYTLSYRQNQITDGSGVNGRLGFIFKPVNAIRIGATFQTPTWMHMQDNSSEVLDTRYSLAGNTNLFTNQPDNFPIEYNLRTPYKASGGASIVLGHFALLTGDVDYVDYSTIRFSTNSNYGNFDTMNQNNADVKNLYTNAINYRVGAEIKLGVVALRAGYGIDGTPYKNDPNNDYQMKYYSGGLGFHFNNYYLDLAYQRVESIGTSSIYSLPDANGGDTAPEAKFNLKRNNAYMTLGVRF
jgi:hypothetical protein